MFSVCAPILVGAYWVHDKILTNKKRQCNSIVYDFYIIDWSNFHSSLYPEQLKNNNNHEYKNYKKSSVEGILIVIFQCS